MALRAKEWQQYLTGLGIPEVHAEQYAISFTKEEVTPDLLQYITDAELRETYRIALGGHRLAIRRSLTQPQEAAIASPKLTLGTRHLSSNPD